MEQEPVMNEDKLYIDADQLCSVLSDMLEGAEYEFLNDMCSIKKVRMNTLNEIITLVEASIEAHFNRENTHD